MPFMPYLFKMKGYNSIPKLEWTSESFQIPPKDESTKVKKSNNCKVSKEECDRFCYENFYLEYLWANDDSINACFIYENATNQNATGNWTHENCTENNSTTPSTTSTTTLPTTPPTTPTKSPPTTTFSTIGTTNTENATTTTHSVTTSINETIETTEENERTTAKIAINIGDPDSKNTQGAAGAVIGGAAAIIIIAGVLGFVVKKIFNQKQTYKPNSSQEEYISLTSKSKEHSIRTKDFVQMVKSNEIHYNEEYRNITTIDTRTNVIRLSSDVAKQHSGPPGFSLNRYSSCNKS